MILVIVNIVQCIETLYGRSYETIILLQDLQYDQDGTLAESGELIPELLSALNDLEYYSAEPPKSLGVEWYQAYVAPLLDSKVRLV